MVEEGGVGMEKVREVDCSQVQGVPAHKDL